MPRTSKWSSPANTGVVMDHGNDVVPASTSTIPNTTVDTATVDLTTNLPTSVKCGYAAGTMGPTATLTLNGSVSAFATKPFYCTLTRGGPTTVSNYNIVYNGITYNAPSIKSLSVLIIDQNNNISIWG